MLSSYNYAPYLCFVLLTLMIKIPGDRFIFCMKLVKKTARNKFLWVATSCCHLPNNIGLLWIFPMGWKMPPKVPLPLGGSGALPYAHQSPRPKRHLDWFGQFGTAHGCPAHKHTQCSNRSRLCMQQTVNVKDFVVVSVRRTMMRTVREDVLEMETADREPAYVALFETK